MSTATEPPLYSIPHTLLNILQGLTLQDQEPRTLAPRPPVQQQAQHRTRSEATWADLDPRVERSYHPQTQYFRPGAVFPLLTDRLSFSVHSSEEHTRLEISGKPKLFFFTTNFHEQYDPYCDDFGPVTIASLWEFCECMRTTMEDSKRDNLHLVYYCQDRRDHIANTAFLLGAYLTLVERWSPEDAAECFQSISPNPIRPYRDATFSIQDYEINLVDCFRGLRSAEQLRWFSLRTFNYPEYKMLEDPDQGDMHIVCPKFIAFPGPVDFRVPGGPARQTPLYYAQYFSKMGVTAVVRLNEPTTYNPEPFRRYGIQHYDLYFDDCTIPSQSLITKFLDIVDNERGMVAVHCKAGLGRTGTLIALWIMKHYHTKAKETIAWLRMVRPGMVIGPQQHFLSSCDERQWFGNHLSGGPFQMIRPVYTANTLASQVAMAMDTRKLARSHHPPTAPIRDLTVV
eukprot:CAMPEP_0177726168 /NCGR_PEP_ID=MMETSP0484_2-20121128/19634_1 /TAXON_ID=354590 /ORGANISM="Rhodomonas lens, Strain RHODO" /LENGTH=454 /DNA_ID=CAMNT_0019238717 /DNA_START=10 /DNA_END=1374 /DNA_ORIENTATION=+